jgi:hypothetical protein
MSDETATWQKMAEKATFGAIFLPCLPRSKMPASCFVDGSQTHSFSG